MRTEFCNPVDVAIVRFGDVGESGSIVAGITFLGVVLISWLFLVPKCGQIVNYGVDLHFGERTSGVF
jgi:hypothetical protein